MHIYARLKSLEKKFLDRKQHWAVFSIPYYENADEEAKARAKLVEEYLSREGHRPTICIFVNEIPGNST